MHYAQPPAIVVSLQGRRPPSSLRPPPARSVVCSKRHSALQVMPDDYIEVATPEDPLPPMKTGSTALTAVIVNAQLDSPEMHSGAVCTRWVPCKAHRAGCAASRSGRACHSWQLAASSLADSALQAATAPQPPSAVHQPDPTHQPHCVRMGARPALNAQSLLSQHLRSSTMLLLSCMHGARTLQAEAFTPPCQTSGRWLQGVEIP